MICIIDTLFTWFWDAFELVSELLKMLDWTKYFRPMAAISELRDHSCPGPILLMETKFPLKFLYFIIGFIWTFHEVFFVLILKKTPPSYSSVINWKVLLSWTLLKFILFVQSFVPAWSNLFESWFLPSKECFIFYNCGIFWYDKHAFCAL